MMSFRCYKVHTGYATERQLQWGKGESRETSKEAAARIQARSDGGMDQVGSWEKWPDHGYILKAGLMGLAAVLDVGWQGMMVIQGRMTPKCWSE